MGEHNIYFVMEFLPGGDLYSLLQNIGSLTEKSAKIYAVQIVKAFEYMHANGIIHRDLKPDNVLIDAQGELKLIDFGLSLYGSVDRAVDASNGTENVTGPIGTPDYMAPEVLLANNHTEAVDFWSLGVLIYELIVGVPPFHGETEEETFKKILKLEIDWSELQQTNDQDDEFYVSDQLVDLLKKLLVLNPEERLTINQIKNHPWFSDIDWENPQLEPPFVPDADEMDTSYFTERYSFTKVNDADILDDLKNAQPSLLSSRSSFSMKLDHSTDISNDDSINYSEFGIDEEDDLNLFPSISLQSLQMSTRNSALKAKRLLVTRSISSCEFKDGNLIHFKNPIPMSSSFTTKPQRFNK